jgi:hypothetical protein
MKSRRQDVWIPAEKIQLEAAFGFAERGGRAPGVIICHPHPQYGGSMDNNVVWALFEAFVGRGYAAVAFNFRGVGRSGGRYEEGEGEARDVLAALDWLDGRPEVRGLGLGVLGYSFGAWVGLRAALAEPRVRCMGAVAPPLAMYSFEFLKQLRMPLFVVSGDRDPFCPADGPGALGSDLSNRIVWKTLAGVDHFFWSHEREAAEHLADEFERWLPPRQTDA